MGLFAVVAVSSPAVASLGAFLFCVFRRRKVVEIFRQARRNPKNEEKMKVRRFKFEELEKATNNFSGKLLLGCGSFGNVYKAIFESGEIVAIKRPHPHSYTTTIDDEFQNEVKLLSSVKHKNLVALVGYCEETTGNGQEKILVYEYVPNGSLLDYMIGCGGRSLTWRQRVHIAIGAAKGIAHLHVGMKAGIIHRDIKPSNILIGDGFEAKVSDFGLVRSGPIDDRSHVSSQIKGTPGYLDPSYCSTFHLTPFSDVYSFGIILLQLVSARPVFASNKPVPNRHIVEWARPSLEKGRVDEILDAGLLSEPCDMEVMIKMGQLGLKCTSQQPKHRPTMTRVWLELEEALHEAHNFDKNSQKSSELCSETSVEFEYSENIVSIEGVRFGKFRVGMDSFAFESASLKCLEISSISIDIDHTSIELEQQLSEAANDEQNKN